MKKVQLASLYSPVMLDYVTPALLPITLQVLATRIPMPGT